ncbi:hypothetical protein JCM11641_002727 [Rhodosporidiobolus odoratus]
MAPASPSSPQLPTSSSTPATPISAKGVNLEEIIGGTRCSPLTLKEFEGFLLHEEHSIENLQFTIWYRDYQRRWAELPPAQKALSSPPEPYRASYTPAGSVMTTDSTATQNRGDAWWSRLMRRRPSGGSVFSTATGQTGHVPAAELDVEKGFGISTYPPTSDAPTHFPAENDKGRRGSLANIRFVELSPMKSRLTAPGEEVAEGPLPFVDEIKLITTTFILPGASKELNIDARLRKHVLKCLRPDGNEEPITTHPDVFKDVAEHAFDMMERSLPHYMEYAKGNLNAPKRLFSYTIGAIELSLAILLTIIIIFFAHSRWYRIIPSILVQMGMVQGYSAFKFFCTQIHRRTARQLYPWELTTMPSNSDDNSLAPGSNVFGAAPGADATADKGLSDLAASLPFLFEPESEPEDVAHDDSSATGLQKKPKEGARKRMGKKAKQVRGKFRATLKTEKGEMVPMFGPERVVEDPWIQEVHNKQRKEIYIVAIATTLIWCAVMLAIPEQHPR